MAYAKTVSLKIRGALGSGYTTSFPGSWDWTCAIYIKKRERLFGFIPYWSTIGRVDGKKVYLSDHSVADTLREALGDFVIVLDI